MNTNFTNQKLKFLAPRGCYVLKQRASARLARVEPVSRRRRCSRLTFSSLDDVRQHMVSPSEIEISGQQSANQRKSESAKKSLA